MRQSDEEIRRAWDLHHLTPMSRGERFKLMNLIEAQRRRDEARGVLLEAEMALDEARKLMDSPSNFTDPHVIADWPIAPPPHPPAPKVTQARIRLYERIMRRTAEFFSRNKVR